VNFNEQVQELVDEALDLVGDPDAEFFDKDEVGRHIVKGYDEFCRKVKPLFDIVGYDDLRAIGNYQYEFEREFLRVRTYIEVIQGNLPNGQDITIRTLKKISPIISGQATFQYPFEVNQARTGGQGVANMQYHFERAYTEEGFVPATVDLPKKNVHIDRALWDGRRLDPVSSMAMSLGGMDFQYESTYGDTEAYIADKDGLNRLRRYKIPAGDGYHFEYRGNFGSFRGSPGEGEETMFPRLGFFARFSSTNVLFVGDVEGGVFASLSWTFNFNTFTTNVTRGLVTMSIFSGYGVNLSNSTDAKFGIIRRLPGFHPSTHTWGIIRALRLQSRNTQVEIIRRGHDPRHEQFEILPIYMHSLSIYAAYELTRRDGPMQDIGLATHFKQQFDAIIERAKMRMAHQNDMRLIVAGGDEMRTRRPPIARPPANYPENAFRRGPRY
jgi:hypothetical protein